MIFLLVFGMLIGLTGCGLKEAKATRAELEAKLVELEDEKAKRLEERVAELESENAKLTATEEIGEQTTEKNSEVYGSQEQKDKAEGTSIGQENNILTGDELNAYINVLYGDRNKLKDREKYTAMAYYLDNKQLSKYYIFRDIDNDGIKELYISDSQTSDTYWWCIFDYMNEEVIIPLFYERDSTIQKSALLNNDMIYKYAHSGLSSEVIYPGAYSSDEFLGENNNYYLYSLGSNGLLQDEMDMFWQSGVMQEDTAMPNLYYIQGKAVSYDEWEITRNQYIVSQEIGAEEYTILSEENLRSNQVKEVETSDAEATNEKSDIESDIQNIREIYYSIQENLNSYEVYSPRSLVTSYLDEKGYYRKFVAQKGAYREGEQYIMREAKALPCYSAEYFYYYNNRDIPQLVFVFVYEGDEEYRYYLKDGKCIRYIDANGTVTDYPDGAESGTIAYTDCFIETGNWEINWANEEMQE